MIYKKERKRKMRKENMITRTITMTKYEVMTLNVETAEVQRVEFSLIGKILPNEKALKALKKDFENETTKVVHIEKSHEVCDLYGMTEREFIKVAHIIKEGGR